MELQYGYIIATLVVTTIISIVIFKKKQPEDRSASIYNFTPKFQMETKNNSLIKIVETRSQNKKFTANVKNG